MMLSIDFVVFEIDPIDDIRIDTRNDISVSYQWKATKM